MKRLTDTQKTAIQDFRAAGLGYKAIAEKLSLSRETVRSFCTRNGIRADATASMETAGQTVHEAACKPITAGKPETAWNPDTAGNPSGKSEFKAGNTVFIISTAYSKNATETLEKKLKTLILNAVSKQPGSCHFVYG